jgi:hypothetical protein
LRAARDIFDTLGCATLGSPRAAELRASGEPSRRRGLWLRDELTAQERQIAQLLTEFWRQRPPRAGQALPSR